MSVLEDFLREGHLGSIETGMAKESVRTHLGDPEETGRHKGGELWRYGALQIGFRRNPADGESTLSSIHLYVDDPELKPPPRLGLQEWPPEHLSTLDNLTQFISEQELSRFEECEMPQSGIISLSSGVQASFDSGHLHGFHYQRPAIASKQMTLFVPEDILDAMRAEATTRGLSIAEIGAHWIKERADQMKMTRDTTSR